MTKVYISHYGEKKDYRLDPGQTALFLTELARARKLGFFKDTPPRVAPDCVVTIKTGAAKKSYVILGRSVFRDEKAKKSWQFYFGLLLVEWLQQALPRP